MHSNASLCPNSSCPSHTRPRLAAQAPYGSFKTRRGRARRTVCKICGRTRSARAGTPYHRMRRPAKDFDLALRMSSESMSATSIARAIGVHVSTVTRWRERGAAHLRRYSEEKLVVSEPTEVQLDELRVGGIGAAERTWAWSAIEVWSRVWLASAVERRTLRATHRFLRCVEDSCSKMVLPTVFATDEFKYYAPVISKVFGPLVAHVEVKNRYANGGIARRTFKLRNTPDFRFDFARERSEDSKRPNTAYVERLNLFERRGVSYLHRRTPGRARKPRPLADALEILRAYYNFIKPHQSLRFGRVTRTPAMQAGCAKHPLMFRGMLMWVPLVERRLKRVVMDLTQPRRWGPVGAS
jgi:transposase-like protein